MALCDTDQEITNIWLYKITVKWYQVVPTSALRLKLMLKGTVCGGGYAPCPPKSVPFNKTVDFPTPFSIPNVSYKQILMSSIIGK